MDAGDIFVILVVILLRLIVPLFIPIFPLPAVLLSLVIDAVDQTVFQTFTDAPLAGYQSYDKALDIYYLTIAFLSTYRNWANLPAFQMSRFLYFYRLVGVVIFETAQVRALLLFFPNTFEYFFIFYEAVRTRWNPKRMVPAAVVLAAMAIWVFVKVPQEYWIHVAQFDVTDMLKTQVFGVPETTGWGEAVANNPTPLFGLLVGALLFVVAFRTLLADNVPPPEWRGIHLQVDPSRLDVTAAEAREAARHRAHTLFDDELWTKVAIVSLNGMIFTHILPYAGASTLQIFSGTLILIAVNTAVSEWQRRGGYGLSSLVREFGVMLVVNAVTLWAMTWALPGGFFSVPRQSHLSVGFLVLLMTLIVTMYDAYSPYYLARVDRAKRLEEEMREATGSGGS